MNKRITPENLIKAGFKKGKCLDDFGCYTFRKKDSFYEIHINFREDPLGKVTVYHRAEFYTHILLCPHATTMAHIERLKELFLGIKPKPEPITQQVLLDNGFTKSLGGGYCFEGGFYSIVVYFYNFHDAPMEIILCGEGESVRFRYKQLEKMTLEDLLALKRIVEY